ncbi:MAG: sulfopyruvate decarboxylase subunit alpha [Actinomycetota bacterium]|nr:sulfopyruvate decarboxylase subunit alpha [Actinomycetota bacterium]
MRNPEEELIRILQGAGVDFTASLPCDRIKCLIPLIAENFRHVPLTREEEGVGICAGAALAGKRPAMFIQNSGLGNMINALLSLTGLYGLPLAIFISHRGVYKEQVAAQVPMGRHAAGVLRGAEIGFTPVDSVEALALVPSILEGVYSGNKAHAFLISPAVWEGSGLKPPPPPAREKRPSAPVSCPERQSPRRGKRPARHELLSAIWPFLEGRAVVCNLGFPSRELYSAGHRPSHFYMLGSMGMATPIGLGIALSSGKEVVVIDGDGSLLMNPGVLATAASLSPKNLTVIAIDNGVYGSTGSQATFTGTCVDLEMVARGFGIRNTFKPGDKEELARLLEKPAGKGPRFIHALAAAGNLDTPVVPLDSLEIKRQVMEFLRG